MSDTGSENEEISREEIISKTLEVSYKFQDFVQSQDTFMEMLSMLVAGAIEAKEGMVYILEKHPPQFKGGFFATLAPEVVE